MKYIIIISALVAATYFALNNKSNSPLVFNGQEFKIVREEGKNGFHKYHYTKSGRDTGNNDYIEILKFQKSDITAEEASKTNSFIKKTYKANYITGTSGQYGVFGPNNNKHAYLTSSETTSAYWYLNYVIQSNTTSATDAKNNAIMTINELEALLSKLPEIFGS